MNLLNDLLDIVIDRATEVAFLVLLFLATLTMPIWYPRLLIFLHGLGG